jgi:hypothetical protein
MPPNEPQMLPVTLPPGIRQLTPTAFAVSLTVNRVRRTGTAATLAEAITLRDTLRAGMPAPGAILRDVDRGPACWTLHQAIVKTYDTEWQTCRSREQLLRHGELAELEKKGQQ